MRSTKRALIVASAVVAGLWATAPAYAAGETFKLLHVDAVGCATGDLDMTVERANLDGGTYYVRTKVTTDGKIYMNEQASVSINGESGWSLFNNFTYGPVPNPGTWPMPQNKQVRIDFTLERPVGTILYAWSVVVDSCNTGVILFNGLTSADKDKDLVAVPKDKCPKLAAARPNGCPLRVRTLTIGYDKTDHKFIGWLFAKGSSKLYSGRAVTIWKVRGGPDKRIAKLKVTKRGNYAFAYAQVNGTYYATTPGLLIPSSGQVVKETSAKLRLH